jgi:hypothetical protein
VNLLLPGGGLILVGELSSGLLVGIAFAACANFALLATLLFPDDFGSSLHALGVGVAGGSFVGAQIRMAQTVRGLRERASTLERRQILWTVRGLCERGEYGAALQVITPLSRRLPDDELVAYRVAQILSEAGTVRAARAAWQRVRQLDRHGVYREQARKFEAQLERRGSTSASERFRGPEAD